MKVGGAGGSGYGVSSALRSADSASPLGPAADVQPGQDGDAPDALPDQTKVDDVNKTGQPQQLKDLQEQQQIEELKKTQQLPEQYRDGYNDRTIDPSNEAKQAQAAVEDVSNRADAGQAVAPDQAVDLKDKFDDQAGTAKPIENAQDPARLQQDRNLEDDLTRSAERAHQDARTGRMGEDAVKDRADKVGELQQDRGVETPDKGLDINEQQLENLFKDKAKFPKQQDDEEWRKKLEELQRQMDRAKELQERNIRVLLDLFELLKREMWKRLGATS